MKATVAELSLQVPPGKPPRTSGPGRSGSLGRRLFGRLLYWSPVWLPLVVLAHFTLLGLRPAWAERSRLEREERGVFERVDALRHERHGLELDHRRLSDAVYRERVRRSLVQAELAPLLLRPGSSSDS